MMSDRRSIHAWACLSALALLSGCDLAPLYRPPAYILPATYRGTGPFEMAQPQDGLPRGAWWRMFGDPVLDQLEQQLDANNPTLQAARETYTQARDSAAEARSGLYPQLTAGAQLTDNKQSEYRLFRSNRSASNEEASNEINASATWEPDFWWRIRNQTKFAKEQAQAVAAEVASARLSLEAGLASDYIALRGLDAEHAVYIQTASLYGQAMTITQQRLTGKIGSGLDVARAQNQFASAQALDTEVLAQRAVIEHAVAVLAGANPSSFDLPPSPAGVRITVPGIPHQLPSELLQRRPDIAENERLMAAANAAVGVSRAAFYPDIRLSAISGFQDNGFNLASLPNSLWAIGAQAMLPLFEGGLRKAILQRSWSAVAQAGDNYRAVVLDAFGQVEDGLVLTERLATEAAQQQAALQAAVRAQSMSLTLFTGGLANYLDVTFSQIAALTAEIAEVQVQTRRQQAAVALIRALGGGWSAADLPTPDQTLPFDPLSLHAKPGDVREVHPPE